MIATAVALGFGAGLVSEYRTRVSLTGKLARRARRASKVCDQAAAGAGAAMPARMPGNETIWTGSGTNRA